MILEMRSSGVYDRHGRSLYMGDDLSTDTLKWTVNAKNDTSGRATVAKDSRLIIST